MKTTKIIGVVCAFLGSLLVSLFLYADEEIDGVMTEEKNKIIVTFPKYRIEFDASQYDLYLGNDRLPAQKFAYGYIVGNLVSPDWKTTYFAGPKTNKSIVKSEKPGVKDIIFKVLSDNDKVANVTATFTCMPEKISIKYVWSIKETFTAVDGLFRLFLLHNRGSLDNLISRCEVVMVGGKKIEGVMQQEYDKFTAFGPLDEAVCFTKTGQNARFKFKTDQEQIFLVFQPAPGNYNIYFTPWSSYHEGGQTRQLQVDLELDANL